VLSCLSWLVEFGIFSAVPLGGTISYNDLARTVKVPEGQLKSVARMAITSNLFCEPLYNRLSHNSVSSLFLTQPGFLDWAKFLTRLSAPTAAAFASATTKWGETVEKNETAFNIAFDTELPFFDYFSQSSDLAAIFSSYMKSVQGSYGTSLKHLVTGFDWESLGDATIIDVSLVAIFLFYNLN
jgi:6-hydroxytryprostatin B O-methyltransferase